MVLRLRVHEEHAIGTSLLNHARMQSVSLDILLCRFGVAVDETGEKRWLVGVGAGNSVETTEDGDGGDGNPEA